MSARWLALAVYGMAISSAAQTAATVQMDFSNPALNPAHWVLTLTPDGTGHFRSERGNGLVDPAQGIEPAAVDREIRVNPAFAAHIFDMARHQKLFEGNCESHMKVAFQGWKKLSYQGPDGSGSCTFNYSKDKEVQGMGESLVAVAAGILEGARLESLLQHDRLGLDKETEYLEEAAKDGRVQQVLTIREILERVADDEGVMERVRKRARELLARAQ
jgi:hypothetical protein